MTPEDLRKDFAMKAGYLVSLPPDCPPQSNYVTLPRWEYVEDLESRCIEQAAENAKLKASMPRWVPVEEKPPENGWRGMAWNKEWDEAHLVNYFTGIGGSRGAWIDEDGLEIDPDDAAGLAEPTHWLSNVPPTPEEGK